MGGVKLSKFRVGWRQFIMTDDARVVATGIRVVHASSDVVARDRVSRKVAEWHPVEGLTARERAKLMVGITFCKEVE